jgi:hypothetical protein
MASIIDGHDQGEVLIDAPLLEIALDHVVCLGQDCGREEAIENFEVGILGDTFFHEFDVDVDDIVV